MALGPVGAAGVWPTLVTLVNKECAFTLYMSKSDELLWRMIHGLLAEQVVPGGPQVLVSNYTSKQWRTSSGNWVSV